MIAKYEKYILKAFIDMGKPMCIPNGSDLYILDDYVTGYCSQLLSHRRKIKIPESTLITVDEKRKFSDLINKLSGDSKRDLVIYYGLLTIVEEILLKYMEEYK